MVTKKNIIKTILFLLVGSLFSGCSSPRYLPEPEDIGTNRFGAYIMIYLKDWNYVEGEFITIKKDSLIILQGAYNDNKKKVIFVLKKNIEDITLRYAYPTNYGWTIPLFMALSVSHGFYALLTMPANIIATSVVTGAGQGAYDYDIMRDEHFKIKTYEQLLMFARFPQGLPANVDLSKLK
ncbi:MAG: hypothetical protein ABSG15_09815 [FCB group bacterium]|jgi:hypothetical protein